MGGNDGAAADVGNKTSHFNEANMIFPQNIDKLLDELCQKLQAKLDADVKAFLESCTKNQHDKVTQFREPAYGDPTTSISSGAKEKGDGKAKYDEEVNTDSYPTHANFAKMLIDERKLHHNNLQHLSNLLQARTDKLEGKTTDCDQSGAVQQPQFGMPLNFYENQTSHASASQFQSAPSASETDKAGQPGASTSTRTGVGAQSSGRALRTDYGASTNRASAGHNVLPNPPKSPSQIPTFNVTPNAPTTDFDDALNRFKDELAKCLENSLGVQLKSSRNTYQKPYPSTYGIMKAPNGWRVPDFQKFSGDDSKSTLEHISMFLS